MIDEKTKIGKDVIESLTLAMYDDPRFIYREYIQNSADQIDIAIENGFISSKDECKIEVRIEKNEKRISISDNGTGVPSGDILLVLKNIAQGVKDRTKHKGFRGIGRLGGLAYCDRLIFETSFFGENSKSTLIWDAKELKQILNNRSEREDATAVIDAITSLQTCIEDSEKRYFRVILENVSNDILLNTEEIYDYLSLVAPVPYKKGFIFQSKVYEKALKHNHPIDEYNLYINNNQVFKEYTSSIYDGEKHNKKKIDEIFDIDFFEIKNKNEQLLCWGWYSISTFVKQIPSVNIARGIRLRKGNIQIGDEKQLFKLFKEPRGSFYFFGEVHAVSPELIPNARRDYFTENSTCRFFEKELTNKFKELHELYYFSSQIRSEKKRIEKLTSFSEEYKKKSTIGFTKPKEEEEYEEKFRLLKEDAKKAKEKIDKIKEKVFENNTKKKITDRIIADIKPNEVDEIKEADKNSPKLLTDNLYRYNKHERRLVGKVFSIIDKILPKELSENVNQKIIEELNK